MYLQLKLFGVFLALFLSSLAGSAIGFQPSLKEESCEDFRQARYENTKHLLVKRGEPILLNCSFALNFNLARNNIAWIKNGKTFASSSIFGRSYILQNGSLKIQAAKSKRSAPDGIFDDGVYFCIYNTSAQTIFSSPIKVTVAVLGKISDLGSSLTVDAGSIHHLPCSVDKADPKPIITWFKDGIAILNSSVYNEAGQFSGQGWMAGIESVARHSNLSAAILPSGVLQLGPVSPGEAGKYHCTASNLARTRKGNDLLLSVISSVRADEVVKITLKPDNVSTLPGLNSYLECLATGNPAPTITWSKNGKLIDFKSETRLRRIGEGGLVLVQTNSDDAGRYTCTADNGSGTAQSATATVSVLDPPRVEVFPPCSSFLTTGQDARLNCKVSGRPEPAIVWYHDGRPVQASGRISISGQDLVLNDVKDQDAGLYHCVATNSEGSLVIGRRVYVSKPHLGTGLKSGLASEGNSLMKDIFTSLENAYQLTLDDLTPSTATLSWTTNTPLKLPPVEFSVVLTDQATSLERTMQTSKKRIEIDGLEPGGAMKATVLPSRRFNDKPLPELYFVVPFTEASGQVRNFGASSPSSTEMFLAWEPPRESGPSPRSYCVHIHDMDNSPSSYTEHNFTRLTNTIKGLRKYTTYGVKVAPVSREGQVGPYTPLVKLRTRGDVPDQAPFNVSVNLEGLDIVRIAWQSPSSRSVNGQLKGYKIKYKAKNSRAFTESVPPDARQFTLKGLKKNTEYTIKIFTLNEHGSSPASKKVTFTTPKRWIPETRPPSKPTRVRTQRFSTSITVLWEPPEGDVYIRTYEIGWGERAPNEKTKVVDSKQSFHEITGLKPSTRYYITVRAGNNAGQGMESLFHAKTKAKDVVVELYPPLGVKIKVLTATTVNVSWHDTTEGKDSHFYVVRYKTNVPMEPRVQEVNSTDKHCIIHNLRPHTYYEVAVKVVQQGRKSPWSMSVNAVTKEMAPGSPPLALTVTPLNDDPTAVKINWHPPEEPNGVLDGYLIFYTTDKNRDIVNWVIEPVVGDKLSHEIRGLTQDTLYYFCALARNSVGSGPNSDVVKYKTPSGKKPQGGEAFTLSPWMWCIIIGGGLVLIFICIATVATVMMCKNRRPAKSSKSRNEYKSPASLPCSPHKSLDPSHLRAASPSSEPWMSTMASSLLHQRDGELRYQQPPSAYYPAGYYPSQPEAIPLTSSHRDTLPSSVGAYYPPYPNGLDVFSKPGRCTANLQGRYADPATSIHTDDPALRHESFNRTFPESDGRCSPLASGLGQLGPKCDSAYGSYHHQLYSSEDSPRATINHGQSYAKNKSRFARGKTSSLGSSESGQHGEIADSARDSRSESLSTDDMNTELANVVEVVNDAQHQVLNAEGFLK